MVTGDFFLSSTYVYFTIIVMVDIDNPIVNDISLLYNKYLQDTKSEKNQCEMLGALDTYICILCRKYKSYENYEDILQDCRMAAWAALKTFNPAKTYNFNGFMFWVTSYVRTKAKRSANKYLLVAVPLKFAKKEKIYQVPLDFDIIDETQMDQLEKKESMEHMYAALSKLSVQDQRLIRMYMRYDNSFSAVAKHIPEQRYAITLVEIKAAIAKLKANLLRPQHVCA